MIYIIGIGRSGSTLLTKTLNRHEKIKAIPEIPVFLFFANKYQHIRSKNAKLEDEVLKYLNLIQKTRPIDQVDITSDNSLSIADYNSYYNFTLELFSKFKIEDKSTRHDVYVDKNPHYSLFIKTIMKLDENAKFIVLVRDPRDNILSRKKKVNNKPGHIAYNSFRYRFFYDKIHAFPENKKFYFLKYEDFVSKPENSIKSILTFIGLENSLNSISLNGEKSIFKIENKTLENFANDHFKDLDQPIHSGHIQKWKKELSNRENALIESITAPYLNYYQYEPSQNTKSYCYYVLCYLKWYILAKWHIYKEYIIYYTPTKVKLWRLKSMLSK
jgi:hypothetical protein